MTDASLWHAASRGDESAFGELFERHQRSVYLFCFRGTADWAAAEDLTSVVFLEAWRRRRHVRLARDSALPWLLGVATNVLRNRRRSELRYRRALARLGPEREPDFGDDAAARLDDERAMRGALAALAALRSEEREAFVLCAWHGLSYEDAAVALGVPVGTVRSRLSRARAKARELDNRRRHEPDEGRVPVAKEVGET
jgi:RNA polymerase sigma-70 factor (ECF subfamily)